MPKMTARPRARRRALEGAALLCVNAELSVAPVASVHASPGSGSPTASPWSTTIPTPARGGQRSSAARSRNSRSTRGPRAWRRSPTNTDITNR